jgi:hypothetical protein
MSIKQWVSLYHCIDMVGSNNCQKLPANVRSSPASHVQPTQIIAPNPVVQRQFFFESLSCRNCLLWLMLFVMQLRSMTISLDGLLDYDEEDREECTFEVHSQTLYRKYNLCSSVLMPVSSSVLMEGKCLHPSDQSEYTLLVIFHSSIYWLIMLVLWPALSICRGVSWVTAVQNGKPYSDKFRGILLCSGYSPCHFWCLSIPTVRSWWSQVGSNGN